MLIAVVTPLRAKLDRVSDTHKFLHRIGNLTFQATLRLKLEFVGPEVPVFVVILIFDLSQDGIARRN